MATLKPIPNCNTEQLRAIWEDLQRINRQLETVATGIVVAGNPTAQVGLAAVNGVATTFMRSDAAPALSQAITPTWTGAHVFSNTVSMSSTLDVVGVVKLGTGTPTFPSKRLTVIGNSFDNTALQLENTDVDTVANGRAFNLGITDVSGTNGRLDLTQPGERTVLSVFSNGRVSIGSTTDGGEQFQVTGTARVTGNLTNTVLAGTGTRLVTSTSAGLLGNAATIAGNYIFSGTLAASNLSGTNTGDQTITLTGDVTGSGTGSFATTIANGVVTNAKIADVAWAKITGVPSTLVTGAAVANQLAVFSGTSTIGGSTSLTFDGSTLNLTGDIVATGYVQASGEFFSPSSGGGYWIGSSGSYDGTGMGYGSSSLLLWSGGINFMSADAAGKSTFSYPVAMASTLFVGGTGTPARDLEVTGSGSLAGIRINAASGNTPILEFTDGGSTTAGEYWRFLKDPVSNQLDFNNGAQRMYIASNGEVGIAGDLVVYNDVNIGNDLDVTGLITAPGGISAASISLGGNESFTYDEGTFTATLTGVSGTVTGTARWVRFGKAVALYLPLLQGTSNATTCTITGMSSSIYPLREQSIAVDSIIDNSNNYPGALEIQTSGTIDLWFRPVINGAQNTFTNSGTKGIYWMTVTYSLL